MKTKRKVWRCYHCDEVFRSRKLAFAHFGADEVKNLPVCIDPLRLDEKAQMAEVQDLRRHASECQRLAIQADEQADQLSSTLAEFQRLTGCNSIHELRMLLDSQQGELITARTLIEAVRAKAPAVYAQVIQ